jgi:hypothetical protein
LTLPNAEQFVLLDNKFSFFEMDVALVSTSQGTIFGVIASENFVTPLFLSAITIWFSIEDWRRIRGTVKFTRPRLIQQHLTRLLVVFSAAISGVLLNTSWVSYAVCWSLPPAFALCLVAYFRHYGYQRKPAFVPDISTSVA